MDKQTAEAAPKSTLERHVQTILTTLITAAIFWAITILSANQTQFARFEEQIFALSEKIDDLVTLRTAVEDLKVRVKVLESTK